MMSSPAPLALVAYDDALRQLLAPLAVVPERPVLLEEAEGLIASGTTAEFALPSQDLARLDGYAVSSLALVGASALSPVMLPAPPPMVACGEPLPLGADAVLALGLLERRGPLALALGEALPGEGVLRRGDWLAAGAWIAAPGAQITGAQLLLAQAAGLATLACRVPRVVLRDLSGRAGPSTCRLRGALRKMGAEVRLQEAGGLAEAAEGADLLVTIGGTGSGPGDRTAAMIAEEGALLAHGIGFSGAPSLAIGTVGAVPLIALPGAPEAALAGLFAFVAPALAALSGRRAALPLRLPLLRKVSSMVGQAELLLLSREEGGWVPLPPGPLHPDRWQRADAWRIITAGEEGWAEGTLLAADLLEGGLPK